MSSLLSPPPKKTAATALPSTATQNQAAAEAAEKFIPPAFGAPDPAPVEPPPSAPGLTASAYPHPQATPPMWRDELTGRVQKFRRKRARMQGESDSSSSLELDFGASDAETEELASLIGGQVIKFGNPPQPGKPESEVEAAEEALLDSSAELPPTEGLRVLSSAAVQAGETALNQHYPSRESVEIVLDSRASSDSSTLRTAVNPQHLMSRRLNAALVDTLVLLSGGGIFAGIFWGFGLKAAQISGSPLNLAAFGLLAACLTISYFGLTVAFSGATPGLAWLGLEVRNLDGRQPTTKEAWARAVCYLISASALFLGFIWALLDSDGLTWHDLMSGTYIVERED